MQEKGKCFICQNDYEHYGNNPDPLVHNKGDRVCTACDRMFVIPTRMGIVDPVTVSKMVDFAHMLIKADAEFKKQLKVKKA